MSKTIYFFKGDTGEFLGAGDAPKNPRGTVGGSDEFLLPANATFLEPREHADPHVVSVFRGGYWEIVADFRGGVYWDKETQEKHEIKELGVAPESSWTDVEPGDLEAVWNGDAWEVSFEVLKARKIGEIRMRADMAANELKANYSNAEFDTWARQEAGARALFADMAATGEDAGFVRALAENRGIEVGVLVGKILEAVQRAVIAGSVIIGKQQRLEDAVLTAETKEKLEAISW